MKNIHALPTAEPSRLYFYKNKLYLDNKCEKSKDKDCVNQNIYITNDEEIEKDKWCIDNSNEVFKFQKFMHYNYYRKIILTTDVDLIKDGVQAIDDEFLEWFVKNPSCDRVEVKSLLSNNGRAFFGYKIIIPKEEPKQETLEEASKRAVKSGLFKDETLFVAGAKWQSERMYSEEEVNYMFDTLKNNSIANVATISNVDLFIESWKKQFKKK